MRAIIKDSATWQKLYYDGSRIKDQPYANEPQFPPIHQLFYSTDNMKRLQVEIKQRGNFNAVVEMNVLRGFMDEIYMYNMPGAYDRLDPNRTRNDMPYIYEYVEKLNQKTINTVVRNMSIMRQAQLQHRMDMIVPPAMRQFQPISTQQKTRGNSLLIDFNLK